jgi:hypothetical protein
MYFATAALASLFATIMAPSPAHADIALPLRKYGKGNEHVFETTVSFKSNKNVDFAPEQLAFLEEAITLSCNESHDANKFHMEHMSIKEATHGHHFLLTVPTKYPHTLLAWLHFHTLDITWCQVFCSKY